MSSQPLMLEGQIDNRDETIAQLRSQVRRLDEALRLERNKVGQIEASLRELRHQTMPFFRILKAVHGELDALGLEDGGGPVSANAEVWNAWKSRLGKPCGQIIDALLMHKSMNQTQISIATRINRKNIPTYLSRLKQAGLTNKEGNEYSLKQL